MSKHVVETFRGRRDSPACKVALGLFFLGWFTIGYVLGDLLGAVGWGLFIIGSIGLYWMPVVYIIEVERDRDDDEDNE